MNFTLSSATGTPHETFNEDEDVNVGPEGSIAGTSGGSNTTVLLETDLEPCAPNAVLHSIRSLLKPVDFVLPDSAAPRAITQDGKLSVLTSGVGMQHGNSAVALYPCFACLLWDSFLHERFLISLVFLRILCTCSHLGIGCAGDRSGTVFCA